MGSNNQDLDHLTKKSTSSEKWGDSEHDTRLHKNLKPHKGKPEYDPKYKTYLKEP